MLFRSNFTLTKTGVGNNEGFALRTQAVSNTWSRAARRKAKLVSPDLPTGSSVSIGNPPPALVVLIQSIPKPKIIHQRSLILECIWLRGKDRALFESFWSHVSRKVGEGLKDAKF